MGRAYKADTIKKDFDTFLYVGFKMYAPLTIVILDVLRKSKRRVLSDKELYRKITSLFSRDEISRRDFIKALMILEIKRMIHVESVRRGTKLIYLLE